MRKNNDGKVSETDNIMMDLKEVANKFVDDLAAIADSKNKLNVGLVPFNRYVNVGTHNASKSWIKMTVTPPVNWTGCVGTRPPSDRFVDGSISVPFPAFNYGHCPAPIAKLTDVTASSSSAIKDSINAMKTGGMTYIGDGVMWGLRVLSSQEPFSEGEKLGSLPSHINHRKVMLVLTDGDNSVGPDPTGASYYHDDATRGVADSATESACKVAKDAGVIIFTIAFGKNFGSASTAEDVMRRCASDNAKYFGAKDAVSLQAAFNAIFHQITNLRLTS